MKQITIKIDIADEELEDFKENNDALCYETMFDFISEKLCHYYDFGMLTGIKIEEKNE